MKGKANINMHDYPLAVGALILLALLTSPVESAGTATFDLSLGGSAGTRGHGMVGVSFYAAMTHPLQDASSERRGVRSRTTLFVPQWSGHEDAPRDVVCFVGSASWAHGVKGARCDRTNGCGVRIHLGVDCATEETQGGHFYDEGVLDVDPWTRAGYLPTDSSTRHYASCVRTGFDLASSPDRLVGQALIVNDEEGSRVSCGLIRNADPGRDGLPPTVLAADTRPMQGISARLSVEGSVVVLTNVSHGVPDGVCYLGRATGLETDVVSNVLNRGSEQCASTNGCGTHIHSGSGCGHSDFRGGHNYYDRGMEVDPWLTESYDRTDRDGVASLFGCLVTGEGAVSYDGHPFILHGTDGDRLSCGIVSLAPERLRQPHAGREPAPKSNFAPRPEPEEVPDDALKAREPENTRVEEKPESMKGSTVPLMIGASLMALLVGLAVGVRMGRRRQKTIAQEFSEEGSNFSMPRYRDDNKADDVETSNGSAQEEVFFD